MVVSVLTCHLGGFFVSEALPTLLSLEVVLHPESLALVVNPLEGVGTEAVLVTGCLWGAAITHQVSDLVCGLRGASPEIPLHISVTQTGSPGALLGVNKIWELDAVAQEERRGVITDDVEVSFLGPETQSESVDVTPGVRRALLTGNGGETDTHRGDLVRLEQVSLGVCGYVFGDMEFTECTVAFRVRVALWNTLTVEGLQLLNQLQVIQYVWTLWSSGDGNVFRGDWLSTLASGGAWGVLPLAKIQLVINVLSHGMLTPVGN